MSKSNKAKGFDVDFIPVPYVCVKDKELNRTDEMIAGLVYLMTVKRQDEMFMSNKYIGDIIGSAPGTVANSLSKLTEKGYVLCTYKDKEKRNRARMTSGLRLTKVSLSDESKEIVSPSDDLRITSPGNVVSFSSEHNKINKKISNKTKTSSGSKEVNEMVFALKDLNPGGYKSWYRDYKERAGCQYLYKIRQQDPDKFDWLVKKVKTMQSVEFFPVVTGPNDLRYKLEKIINYFKRNGITYNTGPKGKTLLEQSAEELGFDLGD